MGDFGREVAAILTLILVVAIIAVLVSGNAKTTSVIQAFGTMFTNIIGAVMAPVTGSGAKANG
jgi:membrane protein involved in colicin uptake